MTTNENTTDITVNALTTTEIVQNALNGDFSGYIGANVSDKAKVRKALNEGMMAAIGQLDLNGASAYKSAIEGCTGAKSDKAPKSVDFTSIVAKRAYMLIAAGNALLAGTCPNGLNPADLDNSAIVAAFGALADGTVELDESDIKGIEAIATQKVTKSAERVDIGAHIAECIEGAQAGTFFSVRAIAGTSTQAAPNGCPSDGAVAMRLFPLKGTCSLIGTLPIKPVTEPVKGLIVTE